MIAASRLDGRKNWLIGSPHRATTASLRYSQPWRNDDSPGPPGPMNDCFSSGSRTSALPSKAPGSSRASMRCMRHSSAAASGSGRISGFPRNGFHRRASPALRSRSTSLIHGSSGWNAVRCSMSKAARATSSHASCGTRRDMPFSTDISCSDAASGSASLESHRSAIPSITGRIPRASATYST